MMTVSLVSNTTSVSAYPVLLELFSTCNLLQVTLFCATGFHPIHFLFYGYKVYVTLQNHLYRDKAANKIFITSTADKRFVLADSMSTGNIMITHLFHI